MWYISQHASPGLAFHEMKASFLKWREFINLTDQQFHVYQSLPASVDFPGHLHNSIHRVMRQAGVKYCHPSVCEMTSQYLRVWMRSVLGVALDMRASRGSDSSDDESEGESQDEGIEVGEGETEDAEVEEDNDDEGGEEEEEEEQEEEEEPKDSLVHLQVRDLVMSLSLGERFSDGTQRKGILIYPDLPSFKNRAWNYGYDSYYSDDGSDEEYESDDEYGGSYSDDDGDEEDGDDGGELSDEDEEDQDEDDGEGEGEGEGDDDMDYDAPPVNNLPDMLDANRERRQTLRARRQRGAAYDAAFHTLFDEQVKHHSRLWARHVIGETETASKHDDADANGDDDLAEGVEDLDLDDYFPEPTKHQLAKSGETISLTEIRQMQRCWEDVVHHPSFCQFVKHCMSSDAGTIMYQLRIPPSVNLPSTPREFGPEVVVCDEGLVLLNQAAEGYLQRFMEEAVLACIHADRTCLMPDDLYLVHHVGTSMRAPRFVF
eukprot:TRINITY_DN8710_c0_g1_i6.p1 TRINITY_DN8710_c0_g1~~TRINITY_DN8710_c0_g1_i6.p1  ORF type:complete len:537 (+),score=104.66 TRINITY_DN8710_c0_g1_i6:149-1612(+)